MMNTVSLLTDAVQAHRRMRIQINTDIVDAGTSWTTALSKLLTSLENMMRGNIADSMFLLNILNDIYLNRLSYLVVGLSTQLEKCHSLTAEVQVIVTMAQTELISSSEFDRLQLLYDRFLYLNITLNNFESSLNKEALKSSSSLHYFPIQLLVSDCGRLFVMTKDSLKLQTEWLKTFVGTVANTTNINLAIGDEGDGIFFNTTVFRSNMANLSQCLLSYQNELDSFKNKLTTFTFSAKFDYEPPPPTSLRKFNMHGVWLDTITSQYIANSLSKLDLATSLHANGNELLTNVDQLYSDIQTLIFSTVSDHINNQEKEMVTFYKDLLQRVASLQRYMFTNDTKLEQFVRRLSIWRMPIVNFQKSQVLSVLCINVLKLGVTV